MFDADLTDDEKEGHQKQLAEPKSLLACTTTAITFMLYC